MACLVSRFSDEQTDPIFAFPIRFPVAIKEMFDCCRSMEAIATL